ncbi:MAG: molybdopterin molybdotransferase MoeA [Arenicella sp.]|nr:molybdopterin molybdotransferase MoeA [Arenicella sp.]
MITLSQARLQLQRLKAVLETETIPIARALGRVASSDAISSLAIPPADNSAMDGFAVRASDLKGQPNKLLISQRIPAGIGPEPLVAGTAARIFTGGVMPVGADAVVIQENCDYDQLSVTVLKTVSSGANVRPKGQDISCGAKVISTGQMLNAIDISLLASIGRASVEVYKPLKVALFSTGDELVEPGQELKAGQIYNSNRPLLIALCEQMGFLPYDCGIIKDTLEATKLALMDASENADVIISSGGVSVGEEDHVRPAVEALGELELWKVQMKPGKPVAFGNVAGVPFLGLPGNPVSSFTVFQLLGVPLLTSLQGQKVTEQIAYPVAAAFSKPISSREEYIRVKIERDADGELHANRFPNSSSGVMSSLSWADGLVRQELDSAIEVGQKLAFLPLRNAML